MQPISSTIVFVVCIALAQGAAVQDQVTAIAKKCASEHKMSEEQAKIIFSLVVPKTPEENCYMECIYIGAGVMKDGKYSVEGAKKLADQRFTGADEKTAAVKLIETCKSVSAGSEKCGLAKSVRECFVKNGNNISFFPPPK
uniref:Odorant-binding protein 19 n=1 Tax=Halyomorpha halys TaxID=286706 RepID=A0A1L2JGQ0_HALHY|nr:odorant-binding protein 19 [Halyomorpha halys]